MVSGCWWIKLSNTVDAVDSERSQRHHIAYSTGRRRERCWCLDVPSPPSASLGTCCVLAERFFRIYTSCYFHFRSFVWRFFECPEKITQIYGSSSCSKFRVVEEGYYMWIGTVLLVRSVIRSVLPEVFEEANKFYRLCSRKCDNLHIIESYKDTLPACQTSILVSTLSPYCKYVRAHPL